MKGSLARLTIGNEYLFGVAPVLAALQANRRKAVCVHVKATKKGEKPLPTSSLVQIEAAAQALKIKVEHSPLSRLDKLSEGRLHQGVVMECGRLPLQRFKEPDFSELLVRMQRQQQLQADSSSSGAKTKHSSQPHRATWVILDRIQDPMNFGAIIRTCCFFGVDKIIVPQGETCALSPIVSKASAGSLEYAPIISVQNLSQAALMLKQAGWDVIGTSLEARALPYYQIEVKRKTAIVIGNEGTGMHNDILPHCTTLITIPGLSKDPLLDSLNVSVATGIELSHFSSMTHK